MSKGLSRGSGLYASGRQVGGFFFGGGEDGIHIEPYWGYKEELWGPYYTLLSRPEV